MGFLQDTAPCNSVKASNILKSISPIGTESMKNLRPSKADLWAVFLFILLLAILVALSNEPRVLIYQNF
jgi:hypothetical protein